MNLRKKMRRGSLAALIALALTSSALAMPTGGVVETGNVSINNGTLANVPDNATITSRGNAIINWDDFSVAQGETLNFNISYGALLNRVTGSQVSEILGKITQTQTNDPGLGLIQKPHGTLILVNPNGIHVGGSAVLDVSNLMLSTLQVSSDDFAKNGQPILTRATEGALGARSITIDRGARVNVHGLNLGIYGGMVEVADGVRFDLMYGNLGDAVSVDIRAGKTMTQERKDGATVGEIVAAPGNNVGFHGFVGTNSIARNHYVTIAGYQVNADNGRVAGGATDGTYVEFVAAEKYAFRDTGNGSVVAYADRFTATPENTIRAKNLTLWGNHELTFSGGKISIEDAAEKIKTANLRMRAYTSYEETEADGKRVVNVQAAPENTIDLKNTDFEAVRAHIYGGKVTVADNVNFTTKPMVTPGEFEITVGNVKEDDAADTYEHRTVLGNNIDFHGSINGFARTDESVALIGHSLNLDRMSIRNAGEVALAAVDQLKSAGAVTDASSTAANRLRADGLKIDVTKDTLIAGGTVKLSNAQVNTNSQRLLIATGALKEKGGDPLSVTTRPNQSVTIDGTSTFKTREVEITGGTVTVDKDVTFTSSIPSGGGDFGIVAGNEVNDDDTQRYTTQTSAGNNIVFRGKVENYGKTSDDPVLFIGNKVTLDGASLTNNGDVRLAAANKVDSNGSNVAIEVAKGNELGLWGTTLSAGQVNLAGGTIGVWKNSAVTSGVEVGVNPAGVVSRTDGSAASVLRDASSSVTPSTAFTESSEVQPPAPQAEPQPTPDNPQPQPEPRPSLAEKDIENIETGAQVVKNILVNNATTATRTAALMQTIEKMNEDDAASQRQTAGVMMGIFNEIATSDALTENEKIALHRTAFESYKPMQEAREEQDNIIATLAEEAVAATAENMPVYPDDSEAEDVVSFA